MLNKKLAVSNSSSTKLKKIAVDYPCLRRIAERGMFRRRFGLILLQTKNLL
jgi:hypothetical protein